MLNIECSMFCFQISKLKVNVQISKLNYNYGSRYFRQSWRNMFLSIRSSLM